MSVTKKNHINPFFWMAIWNKAYYKKFLNGEKTPAARNQVLHYLEINSNKHLILKAENVHYRKNLGLADLEKDKVLEFCKRHYPDQLNEVTNELSQYDGQYVINFENLFTGFEKVPIYESVLECAKSGIVRDDEQKAWISMFLTHHVLRSPQYLEALIKDAQKDGIDKFETLITLKWSLQGNVFLTPEILSIYTKQWIIYKVDKMILPFSDFPIIGTQSCLLAPLGSDTLLMVTPKVAKSELGIAGENRIPAKIYNQFLREATNKVSTGLIFSEEKYLLKLKETKWWYKRRQSSGLC